MSIPVTPKRKSASQAGYFRIGDVILSIPPETIKTSKIANNDEILPLRTQSPMFKKTGNSRWDCEISWKALKHPGDVSDWEDLQRIYAMFRCAPFVEVENAHLRQIIRQDSTQYNNGRRMAFVLRQLRIETLADIPDGLQAVLTMTLFNYFPYSKDFGCIGDGGKSTDAYKSAQFQNYVSSWILNNLPNPRQTEGLPFFPDWKDQTEGTTVFNWRLYQAVLKPLNSNLATQDVAPSPSGSGSYYPVATPSGRGKKSRESAYAPPANIDAAIRAACAKYNVDPNLALSVAQAENNFTSKTSPTGAIGIFQVLPSTAAEYGVSKSQLSDISTNCDVGVHYLSKMLKMFNYDTTAALTAYNDGPGTVKKLGVQGAWAAFPKNDTPGYLDKIGTLYQQRSAASNSSVVAPQTLPTPAQSSPLKAAAGAGTPNAGRTSQPQQAAAAVDPAGISDTDDPGLEQARHLLGPQGFIFDFDTETGYFFYRPEQITCIDQEHGDSTPDPSLLITGLSMVFVNNVAQLPLSAYQYPTYQHVGAGGSMISISFCSVGQMDSETEPEHPALSRLTAMTSSLENQFHQMRSQFKKVSAIHRLQAVMIQNQVLNLFGIVGVMPQEISTETIPDSPNLVYGTMACQQYDNIFEQLNPYLVTGSDEFDTVWKQKVFNGNYLDTLPKEDRRFNILRDYKKARDSRDLTVLYNWLSTAQGNGITFNSSLPPARLVAMNFTISQDDTQTLKTYGLQSVYSATNQATGDAIKARSVLYANDFILLGYAPAGITTDLNMSARFASGGAGVIIPQSVNPASDAISDVRNRVLKTMNDSIESTGVDPVMGLYDAYLQYLQNTNPAFLNAIQSVEATPELQQNLMQVMGNGQGPASQQGNSAAEHLCYRDLGLTNINSGPGSYFVDYAADFRTSQNAVIEQAAQVALSTAGSLNVNKANTNTNINAGSNQSLYTASAAAAGAQQAAGAQPQNSVVETILRSTVIPFNSMSRAFPTFKLFLAEENNSSSYYMFDDFYSYASVLNLEIIRYLDKADQAVLQISNLANLLSHVLYDESIVGKKKFAEDKRVALKPGEAVASPVAGRISVSRTNGVTNLQPGFDSSGKRMNLQYYALQTGSKIQIRMGFSNNPDELYPVFHGTVAQIDEGEILTIMAQGFATELYDSSPDDMASNGFGLATSVLQLFRIPGALIDNFQDGFTRGITDAPNAVLRNLGRGPAYGGGAMFFSDGGSATAVMTKMLKSARARHFGNYQLGTNVSNIMKGYTYVETTGKLLSQLGAVTLSSLFLSGYNRIDENILCNHFTAYDGSSATNPGVRGYDLETPSTIFPTSYYVPKDPSITPWRIIQDIRRRYPGWMLAVKPYGFPYTVDATLVFGNVHDLYFSRLPTLAESQKQTFTKDDSPTFQKWWASRGRQALLALSNASPDEGFYPSLVPLKLGGVGAWETTTAFRLNQGYYITRSGAVNRLADYIGAGGDQMPVIFQKVIETAISCLQEVVVPFFFLNKNNIRQRLRDVQKELLSLSSEAVLYLQMARNAAAGLSNAPRPSDRIKPIRKWIYVSNYNIISNNIELNADFYTGVRVDDTTYPINQGVANNTNFLRIVDADADIIDVIQNCRGLRLKPAYAQSFLKTEAETMYRGELVLTGMPEVEPGDVLLIYDSQTAMIGPVIVESVIHSFDQETGYISIVKPRAMVLVNETLSAGICHTLWNQGFKAIPGEAAGLLSSFVSNPGLAATAAGGAAAAGAVTTLAASTTGSVLGAASGGVAGGAVVAAAVGALPVTVALVAGTAIVLVLGTAVLTVMSSARNLMNPLIIMPLSRYGQPWVAGIDGWAIEDLQSSIKEQWQNLVTYELQPTLVEAQRLFNQDTLAGVAFSLPNSVRDGDPDGGEN